MKHITDIINDYITDNRLSKSALARSIGITPSSLDGRLKNREMTVPFVQKLSETLNHNFFSYLVDPIDNEKEIEELKLEIKVLQREKETLTGIIERSMTKEKALIT